MAVLTGSKTAKEPVCTDDTALFVQAVKPIIFDEQIQAICYNNLYTAEEICKEIFQFLTQAQRQIQKNQYTNDEERQALTHFKKIDNQPFRQYGSDILKAINKYIATAFYQGEFNDLQQQYTTHEQTRQDADAALFEEQKHKIEDGFAALKSHLEKEWEEKLLRQEIAQQLEAIEQERQKKHSELQQNAQKIQHLKELLKPFSWLTGRLWDLSKSNWQQSDFGLHTLQKYSHLLDKDQSLRELAELLGRMQQAEEELMEKLILKHEFKFNFAQKSEFIGIKESDELSGALPSEIALLATPLTQNIFYKKFADKKLQTWEYQARYLSSSPEKRQEKQLKEAKKGPIIVCIDTSSSMKGTPEQVAKTLCFALLQIALRDNRPCFLISFSTAVETLELTDITRSFDQLIQFLERSFYGGTDLSPAFKQALQMLEQKNYSKADVIVVSDFEMGEVEPQTALAVQRARQDKKTRFFSLTIAHHINENRSNLFDFNWLYNTKNPKAMVELVNSLRDLQQ